MERQWTDLFREEIKGFAEKANAFDRGEIQRKDYKGMSGGFGSYAQKEDGKHMLRLRMAGGRLTKDRLGYVAERAAEGVNLFKITTCETIQMHDLAVSDVPVMMEKAIDVEIFTRGGGGDNPRNIMASPLSGVETGEAFDVMPYAEAAGEYLLSICRELHMPRKLKVAFCNGADDCVHSAFRDMGFEACPDGTFKLSIAGGLGNNYKMGVPVLEGLEPGKILYAIRAMIETFCQHGCYTNRAKARTRYMQDFLGADGLKAAYLENYEKILAAGGLDIDPQPIVWNKKGEGEIEDARVIPQKQEGLYAVSYHPFCGFIPQDVPGKLYEAIKDMDQVEGRLAPHGTMYIINLTADEAKKVLAATEGGAETEFETSVSCVGSTICQQGVRNSKGALAECILAVREAGIPNGALPKIGICGCPSSCAAPQASAIGFMGAAKKVDGKMVSAFKMFLGGNDQIGETVFGEPVATIAETDLAALLIELGRAAAASGMKWREFAAAEPEKVSEIIAKYN